MRAGGRHLDPKVWPDLADVGEVKAALIAQCGGARVDGSAACTEEGGREIADRSIDDACVEPGASECGSAFKPDMVDATFSEESQHGARVAVCYENCFCVSVMDLKLARNRGFSDDHP